MFTVRSDAYDLERTCRCCLRELTKLVSLNKPNEDFDDSNSRAMEKRTIGDLLMEFANVQFNSVDGLPQKVCRKCISALRAAFVFRKMCEENDVKLREHFGQHLVSVKEDKFDVYFVDDSCDSGDASKFDSNSNADYPFEDDPVADEKVIIEDDSKMCPNEILMDTSVNNVDENDRPSASESNMESNAEPKIYKCHICSSRFPRKFKEFAEYEKHMAGHKRKEKKFTCDICDSKFTMKRNLLGHMETHLPDKYRHLCSYCGKAFQKVLAFKAHIMYEHTNERPFKCDICSNSFHKLANLKRHKMTHLEVKPHVCSYCSKSFVKSDKLARHVRIHTGERPFVCPHCSKTFNQTTNYKAHLRIHTGETPYKCNHCGDMFSQSQQLLKHRRKFDHFESTGTAKQCQAQQ